jgi:hypothetical protein
MIELNATQPFQNKMNQNSYLIREEYTMVLSPHNLYIKSAGVGTTADAVCIFDSSCFATLFDKSVLR